MSAPGPFDADGFCLCPERIVPHRHLGAAHGDEDPDAPLARVFQMSDYQERRR